MLKSYLKILFLILFSYVTIFAQPPGREEAKKRIQMMKKMKLLEILDLNEQEADKFLIKYNAWEDKLENQDKLLEQITNDLEDAIKDGKETKTINSLTAKYIEEKIKFQKMVIDKFSDLKSILSDENYGKLIIFEERFYKELGKMMWRMGPGKGKGRGG